MDPSAMPMSPGSDRAGFGSRLIAMLIDAVIVAIPSAIIGAILDTSYAGTLVGLLYYVYMEGSSGQTLGKKALNIRVQKQDGTSIDYIGAIVRYVCKILSAIPCGLGFFWMLWDVDRMTWHDKLSSTEVVKAG